MPAPDISEYSELFFKTASDHITEVEKLMGQIDEAPNRSRIVEEIFRHIHSLKGASSVMGYQQIAENCTKIDDIIHPSDGVFTHTPESSKELSDLIMKIKQDLGNAFHDSQV